MAKKTKCRETYSCSCKECESQKKLYKKMFGFVSSRFLFFTIGLFASIAILTAYAAWNDHVSPGAPLTASRWNDLVDYVDAATAGGGSSYISFGETDCAAGWTVAYTGRLISMGTGAGRDHLCVGSDRADFVNNDTWGTAENDFNYLTPISHGYNKAVLCAVCVK